MVGQVTLRRAQDPGPEQRTVQFEVWGQVRTRSGQLPGAEQFATHSLEEAQDTSLCWTTSGVEEEEFEDGWGGEGSVALTMVALVIWAKQVEPVQYSQEDVGQADAGLEQVGRSVQLGKNGMGMQAVAQGRVWAGQEEHPIPSPS